jgi:hypothetical protein
MAANAANTSVGVLGTPANGSTVSGVGVISGYHCTSKNIEVFVDGVSLGKAGAGTTLKGTQSVCGQTETGYSLLYAFNNLSNGSHVVSVTADGVQFDSHTVTTFQSGGRPWVSGKTAAYTLPDFPEAGMKATIQWVESYQNFLITDIQGQAPVDMSSLNGSHNQYGQQQAVGDGCSAYGYYGTVAGYITTSVTTSGSSATVVTDTAMARCTLNLAYQSGNVTAGFDLSGTISCTGGITGTASARALKRYFGMGWDGFITVSYPNYGGCNVYYTLTGRY